MSIRFWRRSPPWQPSTFDQALAMALSASYGFAAWKISEHHPLTKMPMFGYYRITESRTS